MINDKYWDWYIAIKHTSEVIVLISQLLISTAIKTHDASPSSSMTPTARGFRRFSSSPQTLLFNYSNNCQIGVLFLFFIRNVDGAKTLLAVVFFLVFALAVIGLPLPEKDVCFFFSTLLSFPLNRQLY